MNFSLTYVGVIVMVLSQVLKLAGVEVGDGDVANFVNFSAVLVGAVITLYGRFRAGGISALGVKK